MDQEAIEMMHPAAMETERRVRAAFQAAWREIDGVDAPHLAQAVRSAMRLGWGHFDIGSDLWRTEFNTVIFTEYSWGDPFTYSVIHRIFDRAVEILSADPFYAEVWWESMNPAAHIVHIKPGMIS